MSAKLNREHSVNKQKTARKALSHRHKSFFLLDKIALLWYHIAVDSAIGFPDRIELYIFAPSCSHYRAVVNAESGADFSLFLRVRGTLKSENNAFANVRFCLMYKGFGLFGFMLRFVATDPPLLRTLCRVAVSDCHSPKRRNTVFLRICLSRAYARWRVRPLVKQNYGVGC